ncbi:MAG: Ig-like domain-containing protein, partial [Eubacterium sp.]|nr:Ig-like domain-containing protein [Eubacterium sp.]
MPAAAKVSLAKKSKGQVISVKITNKSKLKSMYEGDAKKKINVSVKKKGKVSTKVTYKVANKKILTVNKKGKITAKKAGTTTVTVISAANKKKKDSITITVKRHFEFENDAVSFSGQAGDKIKLGSEDDDDNLYALSFNTEGVELSWKSSDT